MVEEDRNILEDALRQRFARYVSSRGSGMAAMLETVRMMRTRGWTVFVFGGVPRGVFDLGLRYRPRDLDVVFDDEHFGFFESAFERYIVRRNNYGGLRLRFRDILIDAWPLSSTWGFREGFVRGPSFEKLPRTTFLNIDGIIIEAAARKGRKRRIYESGFFSGWTQRILDINLRENPFPGICVARTLHLAKRFGFRLSHRLAMYVWEMLSRESFAELERSQMMHYGVIEFEVPQLREIRRKLEKHSESASLFPVGLFPISRGQMELRLRARGAIFSVFDEREEMASCW